MSVVGLLATMGLAVPSRAVATTGGSSPRLSSPLNELGLDAAGNVINGGGADSTGAIGRGQYIEAVNDQIGVYTRHGLRQVAHTTLNDFWGLPNTTVVVDPQVAWDDHYRRWLFASWSNSSEDSSLLLAWSESSDPSSLEHGWCKITVTSGKTLPDFPKLGFDRNHILIGINVGDAGISQIVFSQIWAIAQPPRGGRCQRPPITSFGSEAHKLLDGAGLPVFTPVAVTPTRGADGGYVVGAECVGDPNNAGDPDEAIGDGEAAKCPGAGSIFTIWHVGGSAKDPQLAELGAVHVPAYESPEPAPQPDTDGRLDSSDTRLTQAVASPDPGHAGQTLLWIQHTVMAPGGGSEIRWYAIDPSELKVVRSGTVYHRGEWVMYGAIAPVDGGRAAILDYNVAGAKMLVQIRAQVAGEPDSEVTLARSVTPYRFCGDDVKPICPWGDYSGASTDPLHPDTVWGTGEISLAARFNEDDLVLPNWGTQLFALKPSEISGRIPKET